MKNYYKNNQKFIVFEFDFAQNRPWPKLPNSDVFYRRLLWLYIFEVHVYNYKSFIFWDLEGCAPKNTNSVCTSLFHVIKELIPENTQDEKELVFLSDSTCAQNKNWFMTKFCSYLSIKFNKKITHLYPVKGHSFSICDSHFSLMTRSTKFIKTIEDYKKYFEIYENNENFKVNRGENYNYSSFLANYFIEKRKEIKITKTVKFEFLPNGDIYIYCDYSDNYSQKINLIKSGDDINYFDSIKNANIDRKLLVKNVGISSEKRKDIEYLLKKYISDENSNLYHDHLKNIDKTCEDYCTDSDDDL